MYVRVKGGVCIICSVFVSASIALLRLGFISFSAIIFITEGFRVLKNSLLCVCGHFKKCLGALVGEGQFHLFLPRIKWQDMVYLSYHPRLFFFRQ